MNKRKILIIAAILVLITAISGCGNNSKTKQDTLNIAYQYGLAYAPVIICKEERLIEKAYKEATGREVEVIWTQMSSGADINTGVASGSINVGFMGIAPAISGISKNVGYKIFTNLSGQEHGLMTSSSDIKSLGDIIGSDKQIALVNIGSIQHIMLAMALSDNGYDPHALDSNIVAMKHPDGMNALEAGSIALHLTSNPYIYLERSNEALTELDEVKNSWSSENSFIVGVASSSLYNDNPDLYKALLNAINEAIDRLNTDPEGSAAITCQYDGNSKEEELNFLKAGSYKKETTGILNLADFMYQNGFTDKQLTDYHDLTFDNVTGD